jgi:hypothetical protein
MNEIVSSTNSMVDLTKKKKKKLSVVIEEAWSLVIS